MEMNNDIFTPDLPIPEPVGFEDAPIPAPAEEEKPVETPPPRRRRKADASVLTIESGDEIETEDAREAAAWHEIHNAYRTRRILSASLGGIEQTDSGKTIAVVDYNGFRIVMMNANAAATTAMTANEPLDFVLPEMGDADFSSEELAEDRDGFTMSFPRIKIPAGGVLQFELPTGDPQHPDYSPTLTGVILFNHASCAYWPEGDEYSDDVPPLCSSVDGKQGYGEPGGVCEACALSQFGSASNGRGKACKNMRVLYLLRSGEFMPLAINLSPTSISPFREFLNQGFVFRNRATYGSLVEIGLKRQTNPEGKDYSVATFKRLGDFHGDQLASVRKYALSFREQIRGMNRQRIEAKREQDDGLCEVENYTVAPAVTDDSFCIGATVNGDTQPLPA